MEEFQGPTDEQSAQADSICLVSLLDHILIEDFIHDGVIVVNLEMVEDDDVAAKFSSKQYQAG